MWVIASSDAAGTIVSADGSEHDTLWLDGIAELELMALAEQLGVAYEPELVLETEEGSFVLRVPDKFARALASVEDESLPQVAQRWRTRANALAERTTPDLQVALGDMSAFARASLAGPGLLSIPMF
jgi:hypothetical protein